jgi:hypothetical protein
MGTQEDFTTESDALLDLVAALDLYVGGFGAESVTIDKVEPHDRSTSALVTCSNGDVFEVRLRRVA